MYLFENAFEFPTTVSPYSCQICQNVSLFVLYILYIGVRGFPLREYFIPARLALDQAC